MMTIKMMACFLCVWLCLLPSAWASDAWSAKNNEAHQEKKASCKYHANKLKAMDTNNDGQVTKEEFLTASQQRAEQRFAKKDKNADGVLSDADRNVASSKRVERFFQRYDVNQDGLVSKEEMLGQTKK